MYAHTYMYTYTLVLFSYVSSHKGHMHTYRPHARMHIHICKHACVHMWLFIVCMRTHTCIRTIWYCFHVYHHIRDTCTHTDHARTCTYTHMDIQRICVCICIPDIHTYTYTHTHSHIGGLLSLGSLVDYLFMYVCMYVCICVCACACAIQVRRVIVVYACMYVCMCVQCANQMHRVMTSHKWTQTYIHIYIHT